MQKMKIDFRLPWQPVPHLVPLKVAVVPFSNFGRHEHIDVAAQGLLPGEPKSRRRRLVVALNNPCLVDLQPRRSGTIVLSDMIG
jgi:hypothetical protein